MQENGISMLPPDPSAMQFASNVHVYNYFWTLFVKIFMATFKYDKMPKTFRKFNFERALMYHGKAMIFKERNSKQWYSLPFIAQGGIDPVYGDPVEPNGVGVLNGLLEPLDDEYVIVYDNEMRLPPVYYIMTAAYNCYEIYMTYKYNLKHQRKPVMVAGNRNRVFSEEQWTLAIDNNEFFLKVPNKIDPNEVFKVIDMKVPYIGTDLLTDLERVQDWFLEQTGCITSVSKAERMNENEVFADSRKSRILLADRFECRRSALEDLASRTDFTGSVSINDVPIEQYTISNEDIAKIDKIDKGGI